MRVLLSKYASLGDQRYQVDDKVIINGEKDTTVTVTQQYDPNDDVVLAVDIEKSEIELQPIKGGVRLLVRKR